MKSIRYEPEEKVFPAPAGINRRVRAVFLCRYCVPRASGDKPTAIKIYTATPACSPRQRG
ncbi:hypothetical protein E0I67_22880 [Salmonella enterica subsp. enterica serovar Takoradi]|nr:hypothetical protein [Salmonella enterica subsp. enterica serovar Takoradi]